MLDAQETPDNVTSLFSKTDPSGGVLSFMADETGETKRDSQIKFKSHLQLGKLWCISMNPRIEIVSETFGSNDHKEYGLLHLKLANIRWEGCLGSASC